MSLPTTYFLQNKKLVSSNIVCSNIYFYFDTLKFFFQQKVTIILKKAIPKGLYIYNKITNTKCSTSTMSYIFAYTITINM